MTNEAPSDEKAKEEMVQIFHTGKGYGPLQTAVGVLTPGASMPCPSELAEKLVGAYKHVRYAKDIVPGGGAADPAIAAERDALKKQVAVLEKQLGEINEQGPKAVAAAEAAEKAALEKVADLTARLQEFLQADKKSLDALKEKHADAVPVNA